MQNMFELFVVNRMVYSKQTIWGIFNWYCHILVRPTEREEIGKGYRGVSMHESMKDGCDSRMEMKKNIGQTM